MMARPSTELYKPAVPRKRFGSADCIYIHYMYIYPSNTKSADPTFFEGRPVYIHKAAIHIYTFSLTWRIYI